MITIPAIDIKGGKVVRLLQGKFNEVTVYSSEPLKIAQQWESWGAEMIHVVDLDGAEQGEMKNFGFIAQIAQCIDIPVQAGGGIRSENDIAQLLDSGIARVVLGTKAIEDRHFLVHILERWRDYIAVSLDCTRGLVAEKGWTEVSQLKAAEFAIELERLGVQHLIYTDIAKDGMLSGPNINGIKEILSAVTVPVIASGGISSLGDVKQLRELEQDGLEGMIIGKALYEGKFYLRDALEICSQTDTEKSE